MKSWSMIVADAARARFFSVEWSDDVEHESSPKLVERDDLVNPDAQLSEREVFSDRAGSGTSSSGSPRHAFDEHRAQRKRTSAERFARQVAERALARAGAHCVLVADKRMLGLLRKAIGDGIPTSELTEVAADLTRQSPAKVLETLVQRGVLPAPTLPEAAVYRPRGRGLPSAQRR
jgi:protein required for attachment to host cells